MDVINNYSLFIIPDAFGKNTKCSAKKALSYSNANICDNWGVLMMAFAIGQSTLLVLIIMVIMPLFLDLPYYVESEMVNKYIDRYNKQDKRATILSVMNMGGNILEVIFLLASACIANIGISVCFIVSAVLIIILSAIVFLLSRSFYQDESENS